MNHSDFAALDDLNPEVIPASCAEAVFGEASPNVKSRYLALKRAADLVICVLCLFAITPFLLGVALAILITMGSPVMFTQDRVGLNGKVFKILKFRTMTISGLGVGPCATAIDDARTTWFGKYLRLTHIDELPQLWNTLVGDMTFIGPRPEQRQLVERYKEIIPSFDLRHSVKPGLTGWAQVRFGYAADEHDTYKKLGYDLYYIKNMSAILDLKIIWLTMRSTWIRDMLAENPIRYMGAPLRPGTLAQSV